jgi:chromosomal replication initiation ATPase DnaA
MHMLVRAKLLGMSLRVAGEIYGKDHATVLHAIRTQLNLYETDKAYRAQTAHFWDRYFKNEK